MPPRARSGRNIAILWAQMDSMRRWAEDGSLYAAPWISGRRFGDSVTERVGWISVHVRYWSVFTASYLDLSLNSGCNVMETSTRSDNRSCGWDVIALLMSNCWRSSINMTWRSSRPYGEVALRYHKWRVTQALLWEERAAVIGLSKVVSQYETSNLSQGTCRVLLDTFSTSIVQTWIKLQCH